MNNENLPQEVTKMKKLEKLVAQREGVWLKTFPAAARRLKSKDYNL